MPRESTTYRSAKTTALVGVSLLVALCVLATPAHALDLGGQNVPKDHIIVYLFYGHSNMSGRQGVTSETTTTHPRCWNYHITDYSGSGRGWELAHPRLHNDYSPGDNKEGPGMAFLKKMADLHPDYYFGILQNAWGGGTVKYDIGYGARLWKGQPKYNNLINAANTIKNDVTIGGVVLMLGHIETENRSACETFSDDVKTLMTNIRNDLGMPNLPLIMDTVYWGATDRGQYEDIMNSQKQLIPGKVGHAAINTHEGPYQDNRHFTRASIDQWGRITAQMFTDNGWFPYADPDSVTIDSFSASPTSIASGQSATLSWQTSNAASVTLNGQGVSADGSQSVNPTATTTYTLTAQGTNGPVSSTLTVNVVQLPGLVSDFTVDSSNEYEWATLQAGVEAYTDRTYTFGTAPSAYAGLDFLKTANDDSSSTAGTLISFTVTQDATVYVNYYDGHAGTPSWLSSWADTGDDLILQANGSPYTMSLYAKTFTPGQTVSLGGNQYGGPTYNVVIQAGIAAPSVTVDSFSASPSAIQEGDSTTLTWQTSNATSVSLDGQGVGADGSQTVSPNATTTYTLTAQGQGGPLTATVTVTVTAASLPSLVSGFSVDGGSQYEWTTLSQGIEAYTDRSYVLDPVPSAYVGLDFLKTANDDRNSTAAAQITFQVTADATVLVDYCDNAGTTPSWLSGWTDTGDEVVLQANGTGYPMSLYAKSFSSGSTVTLGGNDYNGPTYNVIVMAGGVTPPPDVTIDSFAAGASTIAEGDSTTLSWQTSNATSVTLDGQSVNADGSQTVSPPTTTTYTLSAAGQGGPVSQSVTVTVTPATQPSITILSPAGGDVWYVGTSPRVRWTTSLVDNVEILYTTDGGSAWTYITPGVVNTQPDWGELGWTVPDEPSTNCVIYMESYMGGGAVAESGVFEIRVVYDADGDGMDDGWEEDYFGDAPTHVGDIDSDGDGLTDYEEFMGGYDPTVVDADANVESAVAFSCHPAHPTAGALAVALLCLLFMAALRPAMKVRIPS